VKCIENAKRWREGGVTNLQNTDLAEETKRRGKGQKTTRTEQQP